MGDARDLLNQETHFAFGKNWASYAKLVTEDQIDEALRCLRRLLGDELTGKRFLDIGCGSGLHALAALRLGAAEVVAIDIDPDSIATTRQMLQTHASGGNWHVQQASIFDVTPESLGHFEVVYSWGVLHHTGDMFRALRAAAALVEAGGCFAFALYRRTHLCWLWKLEKRWYAQAGPRMQRVARAGYVGMFRLLYTLVSGKGFTGYVENYGRGRGMDFYHDVHDWLGGWPYESIAAPVLDRFMREQLGMQQLRRFPAAGGSSGILGSGCDEYVYAKNPPLRPRTSD